MVVIHVTGRDIIYDSTAVAMNVLNHIPGLGFSSADFFRVSDVLDNFFDGVVNLYGKNKSTTGKAVYLDFMSAYAKNLQKNCEEHQESEENQKIGWEYDPAIKIWCHPSGDTRKDNPYKKS